MQITNNNCNVPFRFSFRCHILGRNCTCNGVNFSFVIALDLCKANQIRLYYNFILTLLHSKLNRTQRPKQPT